MSTCRRPVPSARRSAVADVYSMVTRSWLMRRVLCGHCGSEKTYYVEEVGQYGPLWAKNGRPCCWSGDLEVDEVGDDPHVLCFGCGLESRLPPDFQWADAYDPD